MSFTSELKELMIKHRVSSIGWTCGECSDTHGVYDEEMYIDFIDKTPPIRIDGSYIDVQNLGE